MKQPDRRDSGGASLHAGFGVFQCHPAQSEYRDFFLAGFPQGIETRGAGLRFFENWPEDGKISAFLPGAGNLRSGVTGRADGQLGGIKLTPNLSYFGWGDVIRGQMHALGAAGQGDVGAGVDEKNSFQFLVLGSQMSFAGQGFEFSGGEVFLA